jgi:hypothetical protein
MSGSTHRYESVLRSFHAYRATCDASSSAAYNDRADVNRKQSINNEPVMIISTRDSGKLKSGTRCAMAASLDVR